MLIWSLTRILVPILFLFIRTARCSSSPSSTSNISSTDSWPQISVQQQNAIRSQRDLMRNITIDQIPYVGVNMRNVLFNEQSTVISELAEQDAKTNNTYVLSNFESLLNTGLQTFVMDIEIRNDTWMIQNTNVDFASVLAMLGIFIEQSHNDLSADILILLLNISGNKTAINESNNLSSSNSHNSTENGNSKQLNIKQLLNVFVGEKYIYTPSDFLNNQTFTIGTNSQPKWPTLQNFLFDEKKRLLVSELTDILDTSSSSYVFPRDILHYDEGNSTIPCPNNVSQIEKVEAISWRFLDNQYTTDDIRQYISCGFSPIIANPYDLFNVTDIVSLLDVSLIWTWKVNEPRLSNSKLFMGKDSMQAHNCAEIEFTASNSSMLWVAGNCYNTKHGLCQRLSSRHNWLITENGDSYFDIYDNEDGACPNGYIFSLPRTPLEERSLALYIDSSSFDKDFGFWVNMNCVMVSNCWVIGTESSTCPYEKAVSHRSFVAMIVPVSVISFFLLVGVLYLSLVNVPIQDNRKNWRRIVNQVSKSEFEGVPS